MVNSRMFMAVLAITLFDCVVFSAMTSNDIAGEYRSLTGTPFEGVDSPLDKLSQATKDRVRLGGAEERNQEAAQRYSERQFAGIPRITSDGLKDGNFVKYLIFSIRRISSVVEGGDIIARDFGTQMTLGQSDTIADIQLNTDRNWKFTFISPGGLGDLERLIMDVHYNRSLPRPIEVDKFNSLLEILEADFGIQVTRGRNDLELHSFGDIERARHALRSLVPKYKALLIKLSEGKPVTDLEQIQILKCLEQFNVVTGKPEAFGRLISMSIGNLLAAKGRLAKFGKMIEMLRKLSPESREDLFGVLNGGVRRFDMPSVGTSTRDAEVMEYLINVLSGTEEVGNPSLRRPEYGTGNQEEWLERLKVLVGRYTEAVRSRDMRRANNDRERRLEKVSQDLRTISPDARNRIFETIEGSRVRFEHFPPGPKQLLDDKILQYLIGVAEGTELTDGKGAKAMAKFQEKDRVLAQLKLMETLVAEILPSDRNNGIISCRILLRGNTN
ncbi:MAG: hypothetical protein JNM39_00660 [Bdellovibrionaceae bacterium]|nr:hypothetical protein [Pseudobdellovibrionaceae bacterium]